MRRGGFLGAGGRGYQAAARLGLPLAASAILAGIRVSLTIAIGTATIGSTVGALPLGTPIFDWLDPKNEPVVIEEGAPVAICDPHRRARLPNDRRCRSGERSTGHLLAPG